MHRSAPSLVRVGYANHYNIRCIAAQCACSGSPSNWKRKFNAKPVVPQSSPTNQYHNPLTVTRICAIAIVWYSFVQLGADCVFGQPLLNYGLSGSVTIDEPPMHNCSVGQINDAAPLSHTLINWIDQVVVVVGRSYWSAPPCDNEPCFPKHSSNNMRFLQALLIYPILSANTYPSARTMQSRMWYTAHSLRVWPLNFIHCIWTAIVIKVSLSFSPKKVSERHELRRCMGKGYKVSTPLIKSRTPWLCVQPAHRKE